MKEIRVGQLPKISAREADTHKGDYGKVFVIAGSLGMAGAAALCCQGAYRSGAGLVYLAAPDVVYVPLAAQLSCVVIHPMASTAEGSLSPKAYSALLKCAEECDAVALGPGLSRNAQTGALVRKLLPRLCCPMVVDADGINLVSASPEVLRSSKIPVVLTPHPGELSRLIRASVSQIQANRRTVAVATAKRYRLTLVLKGHRTIVTDGERLYENRTGNPGMATGGSGDVLTGVIAALLGQKFEPFEAACLAVTLHGLAGDLAAKCLGEISMMATDIIEHLPDAFQHYQKRRMK